MRDEMGMMKKILIGVAAAVGVIFLLAAGGYFWASANAQSRLSAVFETHEVNIPVPMPLDESELEEGVDAEVLALERAIERGRHLLTARYACNDCHGEDFGGGVMVDDPAMGRLLGPNLTRGEGSIVRDYTIADWDRAVRHGLRKDGRPALMPSEDFMAMSDQELSDIVAYIGSLPPVDNHVPPSTLGPIGKVLVATGKFPLSAELIGKHDIAHRPLPPPAEASVEFGGHIAQTCTGCHRQNFEGGPIVQGPPNWAPATNLTPHETGLSGYDYESFVRVMKEGIRPNGESVRAPMDVAIAYAAKMTETELEALWLYFNSLSPIPMGK